MGIRIIGMILLFSFPGGMLIIGLAMAINNKFKEVSMKEIIQAIKALSSLIFAEEFSLDGIDIEDRAEVAYDFSG